jgi:hypothetical protein
MGIVETCRDLDQWLPGCMDMFPDSGKVQQAGQDALKVGHRASVAFGTSAIVDGAGGIQGVAERVSDPMRRQSERIDAYFTWEIGSTW